MRRWRPQLLSREPHGPTRAGPWAAGRGGQSSVGSSVRDPAEGAAVLGRVCMREPVLSNVSRAPRPCESAPGGGRGFRGHLAAGGDHRLGEEATAASTAPAPSPRHTAAGPGCPLRPHRPRPAQAPQPQLVTGGPYSRLSLVNFPSQLCRRYSCIAVGSVCEASSLFLFPQPSKQPSSSTWFTAIDWIVTLLLNTRVCSSRFFIVVLHARLQ